MPNFFDGRAIVALSKQPTNYRLLNRKFRTQDGLHLYARITALMGTTIDPGLLDFTFYLDDSYLDATTPIEAHITQVAGQIPIPVNWNTNAHRLYGGIVPVHAVSIIDRLAEVTDPYDIRTLLRDNDLPNIKNYNSSRDGNTIDGVRYNADEDGDSGSLLGISFRLGASRLGG